MCDLKLHIDSLILSEGKQGGLALRALPTSSLGNCSRQLRVSPPCLKRYIVKWNMGNSGSHYPGIPSGKGPNLVGCVDLMDDLTIQGSFLRLYYPCEQGGKQQQPLWIPRHEYYYGLADFLKYNRKCVEYILNYLYGSYRVPAEWGAPFKSDGKYPLVVFSHGLGAFRTLYSAICIEVASRGFVVAAVEHRDGSASATYYFEEKTKTVNDVGESTSSTISTLPLDRLQMKWLYYKPLKEREQEFSLRNVQVHQRAEECIKALNLLTDINMGKPVHNIFPLKFDFIKMKDTLDLQKVTIMGHSFGGATVIDALSKDHRFQGTVHQSFPDFTFLTGTFFGRIFQLKGTIDPLIAIDISNKASLAFMQRHLGLEKDFDQWDPLIDGKGEHIIPGTNIHLPLTNSEPKQ
ncbi:platelet-activating factor acetylhydrolase isoform X4 [Carcharodon carcharias]|uniref:platelet-activating factor acetylhydrolase isoform X4 n=1 Tax=Carcharodon carcharias TaxID=13397 RepID=UPI001B7DF5C2|nr:platelet-activating factor acetylhydrolase isoform X4 [Carcharodon carcharias]